MKKRILLFGALALSSISFAQQFPHVANSNGNAERVASFRVNDSSTEFLEITNSTNVPGQFIPSLWAHLKLTIDMYLGSLLQPILLKTMVLYQ